MQLGYIFKYFTYQLFAPGVLLRETYEAFKKILEYDKEGLEVIAGIEDILHARKGVDIAQVRERCRLLSVLVKGAVDNLIKMSPLRHLTLLDYFKKIDFYITLSLTPLAYDFSPPFVLDLDEIPRHGEQLAGGKAFHLARIRQELALPTPKGFVITSRACNYFYEYNDLRGVIDNLLASVDLSLPEQLDTIASALQELILASVVPLDVETALQQGMRNLTDSGKLKYGLAVRSSAVGEDSRLSFAGQYKTELGVAPADAVEAYKRIIASKYSAAALTYRIANGMLDIETPMAVLFIEMINAENSGVIYTRDPADEEAEVLTIYSLWGLGEPLVSGEVSPDLTILSRVVPHPMLDQKKGPRWRKTVPARQGTTSAKQAGDETQPFSLTRESSYRLAEQALRIESLFQCPQDIEWCRTREGALFVLQARPLQTRTKADKSEMPVAAVTAHEVVLRIGEKASGGAGGGPVFIHRPGGDLHSMPAGAVLVAETASPDLARVAGRMNAAIIEHGSVAGHLASVAREACIPMIVNAQGVTATLQAGEVVTVHADAGVVYRGMAEELIASSRKKKGQEDSPFGKRLCAALDLISPLSMLDPVSASFSPEGCKTMHDILRYVHEKAVHEMFFAAGRGASASKGTKRLLTELPLSIYILDLGGGISPEALRRDAVRLDEIQNPALAPVFAGMVLQGIEWPVDLQTVDLLRLESMNSGAIMSLDSKSLASYILVSPVYLNLNVRFGFHFAIVDVICASISEGNHILFRYKGGGADYNNRRRRVEFLGGVLAAHGFELAVTGDLIDAALNRPTRKTLLEKMEIIGALLGSTRMLDMRLDNDQAVATLTERFLAGDYRTTGHGHV